ncbi:CBS domain-containing protein [Streptacidiphilus sp. MAP12-16]|uniref:CBS domain-containing protein n=1 Tax=Streptacidiphilus sp. MAP12-16 TaxID=3156300 RepID=UPI003519027E
MGHCSVEDVMTTPVVRVAPDTGFQEIVALLAEYDITAVAVTDLQDRLVGVVSEADLLRKQASQEDPSAMRPAPRPSRDGPDRAQGATARELMSSPAVCTGPRASVVAAARLMDSHRVKRLPVVADDGRLVGMVSRSDLLRVFLRGDEAIHREVVEDVLNQVSGVSPAAVGVEVDQGRVVLSGTVARADLVPIIVRLCLAVDGVVSVTEHLSRRPVPVPTLPEADGASHAS